MTAGASSYLAYSVMRLHQDDDELHACGVDDAEGFIPADVQKGTVSDER